VLGAAALAGAAMLFASAGAARADDPADEDSIFTAAQKAVANNRIKQTRAVGFSIENHLFSEMLPEGAILVGFDLGVGKDGEAIYAIRPVYRTEKGEVTGEEQGMFKDKWAGAKKLVKSRVARTVTIRAKPGYAVGGVTIRSSLNILGLSATFMRINGKTLDPEQSYTSDWVGDRGGRGTYVGSDGGPVVGIHGNKNEIAVIALGLNYMTPPKPSAKTPDKAPPEKPAEKPPEKPPEKTTEKPPEKPAEKPPQKPAETPPAPPRTERPADPTPARAAEKPPEATDEQPDDAADSAPKPPVPFTRGDSDEAPPPPEGAGWMPFAVFGMVAAPVFLVLLAVAGWKGQAVNRTPPAPPPPPPPLPSPQVAPPPLPLPRPITDVWGQRESGPRRPSWPTEE
jgi:hypothetical protein